MSGPEAARPLRILVDGRVMQDRYHGIGRYTYELLRELSLREAQLVVLYAPELGRLDVAGLMAGRTVRAIPSQAPVASARSQWVLARAVLCVRPDVVFVPYHLSTPVLAGRVPVVSVIHDCVFERAAAARGPSAFSLAYRAATRLAIRSAAALATPSHAARRDIRRFLRGRGPGRGGPAARGGRPVLLAARQAPACRAAPSRSLHPARGSAAPAQEPARPRRGHAGPAGPAPGSRPRSRRPARPQVPRRGRHARDRSRRAGSRVPLRQPRGPGAARPVRERGRVRLPLAGRGVRPAGPRGHGGGPARGGERRRGGPGGRGRRFAHRARPDDRRLGPGPRLGAHRPAGPARPGRARRAVAAGRTWAGSAERTLSWLARVAAGGKSGA